MGFGKLLGVIFTALAWKRMWVSLKNGLWSKLVFNFYYFKNWEYFRTFLTIQLKLLGSRYKKTTNLLSYSTAYSTPNKYPSYSTKVPFNYKCQWFLNSTPIGLIIKCTVTYSIFSLYSTPLLTQYPRVLFKSAEEVSWIRPGVL